MKIESLGTKFDDECEGTLVITDYDDGAACQAVVISADSFWVRKKSEAKTIAEAIIKLADEHLPE